MKSCSIGFASALCFVLVGCGGGSADSAQEPAVVIDEQSFPDAYAHAVCDELGPCCAKARYTHDAAKCRVAAASAIANVTKELKGGTFDKAKAGRVVEIARRFATSCTENDVEAGELARTLFTDVWTPTGTAKPGDTCRTQNDCARVEGGTSVCYATATFEEGQPSKVDSRCVLFRPAQEGLACGYATTSEMGNCNFNDWTGTGEAFYCGREDDRCHARVPIGAACDGAGSFSPCARGLRCFDGSCRAIGRIGDGCGASEECDTGLFCTSDSKCAPYRAVGDSCTLMEECASTRCSDGRCAAISIATAEACAGRP